MGFLLGKLKKEIEEGISVTMHALHGIRDLPEDIFYSVRKRIIGPEQKGAHDRMYDSDLIYDQHKQRKMTEEELAQVRGTAPALQHQTRYTERVQKVPPGFALKSAYEVLVQPNGEKTYKKKDIYRED